MWTPKGSPTTARGFNPWVSDGRFRRYSPVRLPAADCGRGRDRGREGGRGRERVRAEPVHAAARRRTAPIRPTRRETGRPKRPDPMPMFSSNDKSRWATIRALVDDKTYVIGKRVDPTRTIPKKYHDMGIIAEPAYQVARHRDESGDEGVLFQQAAAHGDGARGRILAAEACVRLGHRPRPLACDSDHRVHGERDSVRGLSRPAGEAHRGESGRPTSASCSRSRPEPWERSSSRFRGRSTTTRRPRTACCSRSIRSCGHSPRTAT